MAKATLIPREVSDHYAAATEKNAFQHEYSLDSVIVTLSIALALYNSLEMVLLMSSTFKKWRGLYCWSLTICNLGVMLYALGILLSYFDLCITWLWKVILDIGWVAMVFCQSLVLYSRLGLIVSEANILAAVKWMIYLGSSMICVVVVTLDMGNAYSDMPSFWKGYYYIEQIQMTWFTLQELIISGLYVWKTGAMLKEILQKNTRSMIWQLFAINIIIISMDIALVCLQFLHFQLYQEAIKGFVYSVKLKLELNILSKLVNLVRDNKTTRSMTLDIIDSNAIAGQVQSEVKRELVSWPVNPVNWLNGVEKHAALEDIEEGKELEMKGSSSSQQAEDSDGISRVFSNQSKCTARTTGRESDLMYADLLRSMSTNPK